MRYDFRCEGELKSSCTCFSSSCSAEVPSIFSSFCLFPGGTPPIVYSPNVDSSVLPLRRSTLVKSSSWRSPPAIRGQRQERPRLAGAHNSACQSTRKVLSWNLLLPISTARERVIDRNLKVHVHLHACFNNSWRSRIYASVRAAEVATSDHRVPKSLHLIDRLRKVGSCEPLRQWKIARPPFFSPQQNGAKNHWIAWQCTFKYRFFRAKFQLIHEVLPFGVLIVTISERYFLANNKPFSYLRRDWVHPRRTRLDFEMERQLSSNQIISWLSRRNRELEERVHMGSDQRLSWLASRFYSVRGYRHTLPWGRTFRKHLASASRCNVQVRPAAQWFQTHWLRLGWSWQAISQKCTSLSRRQYSKQLQKFPSWQHLTKSE